jgi:hypothetical protein
MRLRKAGVWPGSAAGIRHHSVQRVSGQLSALMVARLSYVH